MFSIVWPSTGALLMTKQTFSRDLSCRFSLRCVCCVCLFTVRAKYHKLKYGTELNQGEIKPPSYDSGETDVWLPVSQLQAPSAGASLHHVAAMNVRMTITPLWVCVEAVQPPIRTDSLSPPCGRLQDQQGGFHIQSGGERQNPPEEELEDVTGEEDVSRCGI